MSQTLPNILFYSNRYNDYSSREIIEELDKNKLLKTQFLLIDVDKDKVPEKIRKLEIVPLLIVNGINEPIYGTSIITWLKNGQFQNLSNGYKYADISSDSKSTFAYIDDEFKQSEYNQHFNKSYNLGFKPKNDVIKDYALCNEKIHIDLYEDTGKKLDSKTTKSKIASTESERKKDLNLPFKVPEKFNYTSTGNKPVEQPKLVYNPNLVLPFPTKRPPYMTDNRQKYI